MSFGGGGQIKYTITVEDAQAASALKSTGQQFKELGATTQSTTQQMQQVPQTFQTIVQEGNKVTTTTKQIQQTMQGTVTTVTTATKANQSFGEVLKNNVLSITVAASSIIGLVSQYTSLRKAQITAEKAAVAEVTTRNRVIDLTNKLAATVQKYGAGSTQAAKGARDLAAAQEKASIAADRNEVIQASLNEKIADFAVNILPNVIGSVGSIIQVFQGFSKAETVSTVTTVENTAAQVANATATKLSGVAVKGMVTPLKAMATAEIAAGTAATTAGTAMRTALIRTGIGALLVAAGTALVAFAENWYGFRDAVNAAGVALGNFLPQLKPVLDFLGGTVGTGILKIFGVDIPEAAKKSGDAMKDGMEEGSAAAKEAAEWGKKVADSWQKIQEPFLKLIDDKKWKQLAKQIKELGFSGAAAKKIKVGLDVTFEAKDIMKNLQTSLSFISEFHLDKKDTKQWAKNTIGDMKDAIKEHPELKGLLQPIIDTIKANKNDPQGMAGAIADLLTNNPQIAAALKKMGIELEPELVKIGNDWAGSINTAMGAVLAQFDPSKAFSGLDPMTFLTINQDDMTKQALGQTGGGGGWVSKIIEQIKTAFSPANIESIRQQLIAGLLAAPGNISSLVRTFIDPILSQILNQMVAFGTVMVPQWVSSTFTWANFQSALGTLKSVGTQFITGLWAILTNPAETAKQINTFVTNVVSAIGAWFAQSLPKLSATFDSIFANAVTWFKGLIDAAVEVGKTIPSTIAAWVGQIPGAISGILNNAASWFKGLLDAAIEVAKTIPSAIGAWISQKAADAVSGALEVGKKIGEQIKTGVLAGLNATANWLLSWFQTQTAEGGGGGGHRPLTPADLAGLTPKDGSGTPPTTPTIPSPVTQINLQNTQAMIIIKATAKAITDLTAILPQINLQNKQAMKVITKTANAVTDLTGIQPQINLQNNQAMKIITKTANAITDLTGIQPQINLQNKQAMKVITKTANAITDLTSVKPQINLQNKQAIKVVDVVAKRIQGLENIHPVINVKVNIPNIPKSVNSSTSKSNNSDLFVGGSKSNNSSGGVGMGDTYQFNIHFGDKEIVRKVKREMGRNVYTLGLSNV